MVDDLNDVGVVNNGYFTFDEVFSATTEYFDGDTLAANVWVTKYALQDSNGNYLERTPTDMHRRLAREFAKIEAKYPNSMSEDEIFNLFDRYRYIVPQGSPMSAIGNDDKLQSLSNCFIIDPPDDSYASIMMADQRQAQIMKRRGGVGFDISKLRPRNTPTSNAARTASGVTTFMARFSNTCREVAQEGRRGALMLTLSCKHNDVIDFINIKRSLNKITGANISLRITDEFMRAVECNDDFTLQWPVDSDAPKITNTVKAKVVWDALVDSAYECAEPGVLFWDKILNESPADLYAAEGFKTISTNPCGEIPLSVNDACRLQLLNLFSYVDDPFTSFAKFDFELFNRHVQLAQRLMDDLVDMEIIAIDRIIAKIKTDPESEDIKRVELELWQSIRAANLQARRTGLGITGLGDVIAALGMRYGDANSICLTADIYRIMAVAAHTASVTLAKERGAFPICDPTRYVNHPFFKRLEEFVPADVTADFRKYGRRNIAITTTAPCGSVSTQTQTTSGIEPCYMPMYVRRKKINPNDPDARIDFIDDLGDKWTEYKVYHHNFTRWKNVTGKTDADLAESPYWLATSNDVDWVASIDIQAAAQQYVEHAISKTINLPATATKEMVAAVYMHAWKSGCKGVTVYRDGSRSGVLISQPKTTGIVDNHAPKRPERLPCDIQRCTIKGEEWTIFVGLMDGRPYEVFGGRSVYIEVPKRQTHGWIEKRQLKTSGKYDLLYGDAEDPVKVKDIVKVFDNPDFGGFTRMLSLSLRHGAPIQYIVEQLQRDKDANLFSFARVMARVLKGYIADGTKASASCESCGAEDSLYFVEGCVSCSSCGASACG